MVYYPEIQWIESRCFRGISYEIGFVRDDSFSAYFYKIDQAEHSSPFSRIEGAITAAELEIEEIHETDESTLEAAP